MSTLTHTRRTMKVTEWAIPAAFGLVVAILFGAGFYYAKCYEREERRERKRKSEEEHALAARNNWQLPA